jgi:hypothetical protein
MGTANGVAILDTNLGDNAIHIIVTLSRDTLR